MLSAQAAETELRHAVIDRLIAASLRDATPVREANLRRWREQSSVVSHQSSVASEKSDN